MKKDAEYKKLVFQFGELAHEVEELLHECCIQLAVLAQVQGDMGITAHDIRRSNFRIVDEALNMGEGVYKP